jgi:hypothetical protein
MRKSQKKEKSILQFRKMYFLHCSFLAAPLALHFQDDLLSLRTFSYIILNHSKWRRIEKDLPKCSVIV